MYYEILELDRGAGKREIRRAYATKIREYHPEEEPEKFSLLQEEYQRALKDADREVGSELQNDIMVESEVPVQESVIIDNILSDRLDQFEEEEFSKQMETPIFKKIRELFEDTKKSISPKAWQCIFDTMEFWDVWRSEVFVELLTDFLMKQSIYSVDKLPQGLMVELATVYVLDINENGYAIEYEGADVCNKIAGLWNLQDETWRVERGARIVRKDVNQ